MLIITLLITTLLRLAVHIGNARVHAVHVADIIHVAHAVSSAHICRIFRLFRGFISRSFARIGVDGIHQPVRAAVAVSLLKSVHIKFLL